MNIYAERCGVLHKYSFLCRVIQFGYSPNTSLYQRPFVIILKLFATTKGLSVKAPIKRLETHLKIRDPLKRLGT